MILRIKRIYDAPSTDDGKRIFVDRLWARILDGIMMSAYFNLGTALWWLIDPVAFYDDFPKEAKEKTTIPKPEKNKKPAIIFCAVIIVPVLLFGVLSAWDAGVSGFWHLSWTGYLE